MYTKPLVVAATLAEIAPSIPSLDRHGIPYLITGVGMVATAHSLTRALLREEYAYVLNVGLGGSFDRDIPLGAVLEVSRDTFSELGAEDRDDFLPIEGMGFGQATWNSVSPADRQTGLPQVSAITVNTVHGAEPSISSVTRIHPDVSVESMEGAAVFYVCAMENTACLQVRSISNYVEARNRENWDLPCAIEALNAWMSSFLAI